MSNKVELDSGLFKAALWSGVAFIVATIVAQGLLMHFIPPPSPTLSARELALRFIGRRDEIRLGCLIQCIFWSFLVTWGVTISVFLRKMERGYPILTYASIALVGGGDVFFILVPMTWAVIAYRPETLDPMTIQVMNDWVWFDYLFTWPPFSLWMVVIAIAVFKDHNVPALYPRWIGYLSLWSAMLLFPAGLIVFFRTGPFAYDGVGAFWIPFAIYFTWMTSMTVTTFQAINRQTNQSIGPALTPA